MDWKNIGSIENIPRQGSRRICLKAHGRPVAVFRTAADEVFALIDECPHKQGPLSEGIVSGRTVTCPLHSYVIGLDDGKAVAPDEGTTNVVPVRLVDGNVHIALPGDPG